MFFEQRPAFFGQPFIDYIHIDGEPTGASEALLVAADEVIE